ncbi:MAG: ATP-binding protein [Bacteroidota bacterium]|jgi:predicted AAA+ superfamily ATPase
MISRSILKETKETANDFKVICVTGPRQSGKTTLCKQVFKNKPYVTLEDPDIAALAKSNERKFLNQFKNGAILDEVQRVPTLFNYLQGIVDSKNKNNQFVLTGSNNFLMQQNISQSLAGRVGYIELLPFSLNELKRTKYKNRSLEESILNGFYPSIVTKKTTPQRWLSNYLMTYVERDVRLIKNIGNTFLFNKFIKLVAGRAAQLLNVNTLANEVGVDNKTINSWLGILQSSYIAYSLIPFHQNFNKRVIKSPKIYFYDTGLLCFLLNIHSISALKKSKYYGAIFENFIVSEIKKNRTNKEQNGEMYFFRDSAGNEVDLILEKEEKLIPIEIKSAKKVNTDSTKNLRWFNKVFREDGGILINSGDISQTLPYDFELLSWKMSVDI